MHSSLLLSDFRHDRIMPVGLAIGLVVVYVFEKRSTTGSLSKRKALLASLTAEDDDAAGPQPLDPAVARQLGRWIDGYYNVAAFWSGGVYMDMRCSPSTFAKAYEMLALVSALMLTICVQFYTANSVHDHVYGLLCCVANCFLWMSTISSAFFATAVSTCNTANDVALLVGMYGKGLMRVPMMLFVNGALLLFLEFVLYFKINVDPGYNCSVCLGACFCVVPLFMHCMHKMGWACGVVSANTEAKKGTVTPAGIRGAFAAYVATKGGDGVLALDRGEFLGRLDAATSVQRTFAAQLFDTHVAAALAELHAADAEGEAAKQAAAAAAKVDGDDGGGEGGDSEEEEDIVSVGVKATAI